MDDTFRDLTRFVEWEGEVEWLPADAASAARLELPPHWAAALGRDTVRRRVTALWSPLAELLPRTSSVFAAKVSELALLRTLEHGFSLVYLFDVGSDLAARRGFAPVEALPPEAARFPVDLLPLYRLHDGLVHMMSYDGGPLRAREWRSLADPSSGVVSLVKIATDGGDAFGFDISETAAVAYAIRPDDEEVEPVADPWAFLDDLMASRIEDL
ncbi:hypothetical protein GCM10028796_42290 [Ramlibacter monticola]|uniref:Uncharacterized protein n=1 Tax=Ramlibacter monticola TaxID=1926872 RepID=A0A936Z0S9_9BURK|nr:hypothetical protein [Ramlibacter monticola]MBL0392829.1 hypothetical protein [Ramlibacter monticola]